MKKPWEVFCRTSLERRGENYFACVDQNGFWFDTASDALLAIHWCAMHEGLFRHYDEMDEVEEIDWWKSQKKYSIIHRDLLKKMYEADLIK